MSSDTSRRVYLSLPDCGELEQQYVADAFRSGWLSTAGPHLDNFEAEMAELLGDVHTVAVSSGTAALHLILRHAGVEAADTVAVSTFTFAGSVFPISYLGASPVFVDCESTSWNMDPALLEEYLTTAARRGELPRALILVHLYGQHADLDAISGLCDRFGVTLVEDAAESLGSTYKGRQTGTTAPYSLLSFNGNKILTTTGGGMVVARSGAAAEAMRKWANQAREPVLEYLHTEIGYNYRMSNVLAAIGRGQLRGLEQRIAARRAVADRYAEAFAGMPLRLQPEAHWGRHTRWLSVVLLEPPLDTADRDSIITALARENIESRPPWKPMHTQPVFQGCLTVGGARAEDLAARGLCLPSSSSLTREDQNRVIDVVCDCVMAANRSR